MTLYENLKRNGTTKLTLKNEKYKKILNKTTVRLFHYFIKYNNKTKYHDSGYFLTQ